MPLLPSLYPEAGKVGGKVGVLPWTLRRREIRVENWERTVSHGVTALTQAQELLTTGRSRKRKSKFYIFNNLRTLFHAAKTISHA